MNLFCTGVQSDGYGYKIIEANEVPGDYYVVSRDFESDSGGNANLTWYVGDQGAVPINMNNGAGDPATGKWIVLTSADPANPAAIRSGSTVFNGTYDRNYINIQADMQQIVNIIFRTDANNISGTVGPYIIGADDPNDFFGLIVRDCQFYGCKDAVHIARQKNALVLDNRIELGDFPAHQVGIVLGAPGGAAVGNDIKGPTGVDYFAACCFGIMVNLNVPSDTYGIAIIGNYIHDFTSTGNYRLPFAGIGINGGAGIIANNVIYNIQCADSEPPSDSDKWGAIYVYSLLEQGHIGLMYNNILMNCIKGVNLGSGSVGYLDYNCIYNCNKAYIGTEAGPHDIFADPCFVDAANGDFRLKANSPCLNTGKPTLSNGFSNMGAWQGISRGVPSPANCTEWLEMDFNDDCKVDFSDFAMFAEQWLECNLEPQELCWQ
jgi:hypothetical protein